jgi:hypothetical protein
MRAKKSSRKQVTEEAPKVTQIPMPISDSALVIDLPDGQKLVVGRMEHGTVIEVATWRGTGRPDSRTNRMMLGMSSSENQVKPTEEDQEHQSSPQKLSFISRLLIHVPKVKEFALNLINLTVALLRKLKILFISKNPIWINKSKKMKNNNFPSIESNKEIDEDIEDWLNRIKAKSIERTFEKINTAPSKSKVKRKVNKRK